MSLFQSIEIYGICVEPNCQNQRVLFEVNDFFTHSKHKIVKQQEIDELLVKSDEELVALLREYQQFNYIDKFSQIQKELQQNTLQDIQDHKDEVIRKIEQKALNFSRLESILQIIQLRDYQQLAGQYFDIFQEIVLNKERQTEMMKDQLLGIKQLVDYKRYQNRFYQKKIQQLQKENESYSFDEPLDHQKQIEQLKLKISEITQDYTKKCVNYDQMIREYKETNQSLQEINIIMHRKIKTQKKWTLFIFVLLLSVSIRFL